MSKRAFDKIATGLDEALEIARTANPTPCEDCDHVTAATRKLPSHRWACIKFPKIEGFNPVAPRQWVRDEPYMRCVGINGGHCELFTPKREGKIPV